MANEMTLLGIWRKLDAWEAEQDDRKRVEMADELRQLADRYPQWDQDIVDAGIQI